MKRVFLLLVLCACASLASATTMEISAGDSGSLTIYNNTAETGSTASIWGFYKDTSNNWISASFGTTTMSSVGLTTLNYSVPSDYASDFYWNVTLYHDVAAQSRTTYSDTQGAWGQFLTQTPDNYSVYMDTYAYDQYSVSTSSATFRASNSQLPYPPSNAEGSVSARRPWTGTMADYTNSSGADSYYSNSKTGLYPSYIESLGYSIDVLEGDAGAVQQFQRIRLHNDDYSYSVDLFAYKNSSTADAAGYIYWTTLVTASEADCSYDPMTGVFTGNFDEELDEDTMYFLSPVVVETDAFNSSCVHITKGPGSSDLLLGGVMVPEPLTAVIMLGGAAIALRRKRSA